MPKDSGTRIWDHGPPQSLSNVTGTNTSQVWSGTAVHGGMVTVDATRSPDTAKAAGGPVTVTARSGWTVADRGFARGPGLTSHLLPSRALLGRNTDRSGSENSDDILKGGRFPTPCLAARTGVTAT